MAKCWQNLALETGLFGLYLPRTAHNCLVVAKSHSNQSATLLSVTGSH